MVCTLIDNDNGHHTDQNVVDQRGTATPNHRRHCVTHWREQRCLYSYRELWVKWISARSGRFKVCGNECLYCIYISSYWNSLPSVIFWKFILSGICIELLRNFRGGTHLRRWQYHILRDDTRKHTIWHQNVWIQSCYTSGCCIFQDTYMANN